MIEKIGQYTIIEKIATGGMAEVYLAKVQQAYGFHKFFAIKKIHSQFSDNLDYLSRLKDEAKISLNMNHRNIVHLQDIIYDKGQLYLVMEYINGINLRQLLNDLKFTKAQISLPAILYMMSEIAAGLDYAHRGVDQLTQQKLNLIHRDLNPTNIMISFEGVIKIIDFGVSKSSLKSENTVAHTIKGKYSYLSPEQVNGELIDHRTDLFALGITFWEVLTKEKLFEAHTDPEILQKIKSAQIHSPKLLNFEVTSELEKIVMRLLQRDIKRRYQNAADLKYDIDAYLTQSFPEFRPQHFLDFIKSLYEDVITHNAEKLRSFAARYSDEDNLNEVFSKNEDLNKKLQPPPIPTNLLTAKVTPLADGFFIQTPTHQTDLPDGFEEADINMKSSPKDFEFKKINQNNLFANEVNIKQKQRSAEFFSDNKSLYKEKKDNFSFLDEFFSYFGFINRFKHLAFLCAIFYVIYSFYNNNQLFLGQQSSNKDIRKVSAINSTESVGLINNDTNFQDKKTTSTDNATPKTTEDSAGIPLISNEDFSKIIKQRIQSGNKQISYLNIQVVNPRSASTKIFIDNQQVVKSLPIKMFPVSGNRILKISAYDSINNLYDIKEILIPFGETATINLVLKPYTKKK